MPGFGRGNVKLILNGGISSRSPLNSTLTGRPIGAQFMQQDVIALFEFEEDGSDIRIVAEKQYQLVPTEAVTREDLKRY